MHAIEVVGRRSRPRTGGAIHAAGRGAQLGGADRRRVAGRASARPRRARASTTSGIGSTGLPIEQSTTPPGTASATARQLVEAVVRVRRRDEPGRAHRLGSSRSASATVAGRVTKSTKRPVDRRRAAGPAPACRESSCTSTSTSPSRCSAASTSPRSYGTSSSTIGVERAQPVADAPRSSSTPSPVSRRDRDRVRVRRRASLDTPGVGDVGLVDDEQLGHVAGADLAEHRRAPLRSARSASGAPASTTWTSRSASTTSSSVERNASTSWCGSRRTNPTVSESEHRLAAGQPQAAGGRDRAWRTSGPRRARRRR